MIGTLLQVLDLNVSNTTLETIALVLFILCALVWLFAWGWGKFR